MFLIIFYGDAPFSYIRIRKADRLENVFRCFYSDKKKILNPYFQHNKTKSCQSVSHTNMFDVFMKSISY